MSYLKLTRVDPPGETVVVNMAKVLCVEPTSGGSRLNLGNDERPVVVTASVDKIAALLGADNA